MPHRKDIDDAIRDWPYEPGEVSARLVPADDGREVLQMRIDMGVLQMEVANRPDGEKPHGAETFLDYVIQESIHGGDDFELSEDQCMEVDREFIQFYHRRICWLALREFSRAVEDADHTLALMDFVLDHSPDQEWNVAHEQYRPFVLFQRTQAVALSQLEQDDPEVAVEEINRGLDRIREVFQEVDGEQHFEDDTMVDQLRQMRESIRQRYEIGRTLPERLADAVASEQYELAAQLRDELARRHPGNTYT